MHVLRSLSTQTATVLHQTLTDLLLMLCRCLGCRYATHVDDKYATKQKPATRVLRSSRQTFVIKPFRYIGFYLRVLQRFLGNIQKCLFMFSVEGRRRRRRSRVCKLRNSNMVVKQVTTSASSSSAPGVSQPQQQTPCKSRIHICTTAVQQQTVV